MACLTFVCRSEVCLGVEYWQIGVRREEDFGFSKCAGVDVRIGIHEIQRWVICQVEYESGFNFALAPVCYQAKKELSKSQNAFPFPGLVFSPYRSQFHRKMPPWKSNVELREGK